jgi:MFS family permease
MTESPDRRPPSITATLQQIPGRIWLVLFGMLVNRLGNFLQIFLVLYLTNKGFSASGAALALGAYGAGAVVGVLLGGAASDRLGHAWTITGSMLVAGALTLSLVHITTLPMISAVAGVLGLVAQAYRPASAALLVESTPAEQHVIVFAIYRMAFNLGTTAGPLLGALLLARSYDLIFYAEAAAQLAFALCAYVALIGGRSNRSGAAAKSEEDGLAPAGYAAVLRDGRYVLFMLALFLNAVVYIQHTSVLPLQIKADGLSPTFYASLLSLNAIMVIGLELLLTKYVQLLPGRVAVAVGIGLVGVGMNLYVAGPALAMFVVATVVWTLGEIIGTPTASAHPGRVAPPHLRGRYIAAAAFPMQIGYAAGPVLGVAVWSAAGDLAWWLSGAVTVVAVVAVVAGMTKNEPAGDLGDLDVATATAP